MKDKTNIINDEPKVMNDRTKELFKLLGVEPYERFKLKKENWKFVKQSVYFLDDNLVLYFIDDFNEPQESTDTLVDLIKFWKIIKLPKKIDWTENEKAAAKYWRACGFEWFCRDADGTILTHKSKPYKDTKENQWKILKDDYGWQEVMCKMPHIQWEDDEPVYVEDILKEL